MRPRIDPSATPPPHSRPRFLNLAEVMHLANKSKSSIYRDMALGLFPKPKRIGRRRVGWLESEIYEWIESRPSITYWLTPWHGASPCPMHPTVFGEARGPERSEILFFATSGAKWTIRGVILAIWRLFPLLIVRHG